MLIPSQLRTLQTPDPERHPSFERKCLIEAVTSRLDGSTTDARVGSDNLIIRERVEARFVCVPPFHLKATQLAVEFKIKTAHRYLLLIDVSIVPVGYDSLPLADGNIVIRQFASLADSPKDRTASHDSGNWPFRLRSRFEIAEDGAVGLAEISSCGTDPRNIVLDTNLLAARGDTASYPRSVSGRRTCASGSLSVAFHAASNSPSANQLSVASRRAFQKPVGKDLDRLVIAGSNGWYGVSIAIGDGATGDGIEPNRGPIMANDGSGFCSENSFLGYDSLMKKNIAIVEDEPALRENYAAALSRHGYSVKTFANRTAAMQAFQLRLPDLAIIDISLEDEAEGGFDLCRELRASSAELPIIFLTARDSELDAVSGLRLGADDFITKDVSLPHLAARVAALFRRIDALKRPDNAAEIIRRGALSIDGEKMQTTWNGRPVTLSLTEFWIVHALARNPGHVKNRQQLMDAANVVLDDNTITSHIKRVRRKFQQIDPAFDAVQTVYGMGYRWVE